ncbi:MAG TPA: hypothetical protein VHE59_10525 [Mucilaginibacter sp.]|nr:hypothetical protein [Mucilaginibacter sp.]
MRGQKIIQSALQAPIEAKPLQKGHRNVHLDRRDDALAARFYYHYQIKEKRFERALLDLEAEFFIVPNVIIQRLALRKDYLKELGKKAISVKQLRELFPFYAWN